MWVAWVCGPERANRRSTAFAQVNCVVVITLYIYSMTVEEYLNTAKEHQPQRTGQKDVA